MVTMEAMAAGKPVVAADAMAQPHPVHPGRNGYLFPPGDVRALADRLMELLDDPAARGGWARPPGDRHRPRQPPYAGRIRGLPPPCRRSPRGHDGPPPSHFGDGKRAR
ncbi:glycosyltransferase [Streptomyces sp. NBC_01795]|uniref:glycosyltransferase n=1 Tax=Streptomyces sp. NBC_01795 TaxID=2975943 RepID=UPI002DDB1D86|nr:glycosyltransferase [Streptomyces sp. NBC_01795]